MGVLVRVGRENGEHHMHSPREVAGRAPSDGGRWLTAQCPELM